MQITAQLAKAWVSSGRVENVADFDPVEAILGQSLPADYKYFLMWSNGGETLPPLPRYRFYPLEELLERRADGQPPDVLEFATDDSDGYAFDLSLRRDTAKYPVVHYPLGETERVDVERIAEGLAAFLTSLFER